MADSMGMGRGPRIDIETVRETLTLIHDDLAGAPDLQRIRQALSAALDEIDAMAAQCRKPPSPLRLVTPAMPNFVPWSPRGK